MIISECLELKKLDDEVVNSTLRDMSNCFIKEYKLEEKIENNTPTNINKDKNKKSAVLNIRNIANNNKKDEKDENSVGENEDNNDNNDNNDNDGSGEKEEIIDTRTNKGDNKGDNKNNKDIKTEAIKQNSSDNLKTNHLISNQTNILASSNSASNIKPIDNSKIPEIRKVKDSIITKISYTKPIEKEKVKLANSR